MRVSSAPRMWPTKHPSAVHRIPKIVILIQWFRRVASLDAVVVASLDAVGDVAVILRGGAARLRALSMVPCFVSSKTSRVGDGGEVVGV